MWLPRWASAVLAVLVAACLLVGNARVALWDQDEAAYAGFALRMLRTGDWVVPEFPMSEAHRKPPLQFWLMAGSFAIFGVSEFAARLPSVLAVVGTALLVARGGAFLVGRRTARTGAIVLMSSVLVLTLGKIALADAGLLFCQTVAALALLRGMVRPSWRATVGLWAAVAAGLLFKGPPVLVLVVAMMVFLLVFHRRRWRLVHFHPWVGLPLALVPLAVWVVLVWQRDPRLVLTLADWYILRRLGGAVFGQAAPPGMHLLLLFVLVFPWTVLLPGALRAVWRGLLRRQGRFVLLGAWLFGGWLIWELPLSKLPTYTLGSYPAFALLIAHVSRQVSVGRVRWGDSRALRAAAWVTLGLAVLAAVAVTVGVVWVGTTWVRWLVVVPAGAVVWGVWRGVRLYRDGQAGRANVTLAGGFLASYAGVWLVVAVAVAPQLDVTRRAARGIAERCPEGSTVLVARPLTWPSFAFYVERAGLELVDATRRPAPPRPSFPAAWLWELRVKEIRAALRAERPPQWTAEEALALRREAVLAAARDGTASVVLVDEATRAAVADEGVLRRVSWHAGWALDRGALVKLGVAEVGATGRDPAAN